MMLYGAPVWADGYTLTRKNVKILRRVQRRMAIRLIRAYRTTAGEVAIVLAGMIPFDHLVKAYSQIYWGSHNQNGRDQESVGTPPSPTRMDAETKEPRSSEKTGHERSPLQVGGMDGEGPRKTYL